MVTELIALILLGVAAFCDCRARKIPLVWVLLLFGCALIRAAHALTHGGNAPHTLLLAALPGAALMLLSVCSGHAMGLGDGLVLLAAGPVFGFAPTLTALMIAFFCSALVSALLLACKKADRKTRIPFVPFLAAALGVMCVAHL